MNHDLLHIQGKPYILLPLHEYRMMTGTAQPHESDLPDEVLDRIFARTEHPVKILRNHRGVTQVELAQAANLSRPYLTEIETGKKEGSISAIKALAEALNVPPGLLI